MPANKAHLLRQIIELATLAGEQGLEAAPHIVDMAEEALERVMVEEEARVRLAALLGQPHTP